MPTVSLPNILLTGTPGSGKSFLAKALAEEYHMTHRDVSEIVKEHDFIDGYDPDLDCPYLDEDKLLDYLEPIMQNGGNIVEYHSNELFPERWFQIVLVVKCNTEVLFDRLKARNYNEIKIQNNMQCEIFETILEEAIRSYKTEIIHQVSSLDATDVEFVIDLVGKLMKEIEKK